MTPCAREALELLFRLGERAFRSASSRRVTVRFDGDRFTAYHDIGSWHEKQDVHAELKAAEVKGAISIEWARVGGDDPPISRIVLQDISRLAQVLDLPLYHDAVESAAEQLLKWNRKYPRVDEVLAAWRVGRRVRRREPSQVDELLDAIRTLEQLSGVDDDMVLRRASARWFGDSKRIERITPMLDVLTAESLNAPPRPSAEVWASIGLRKEPQSALFSGVASVVLASGTTIPMVSPYLGLSPKTIDRITGELEFLLTIENLASFHEVAEQQPIRGVALYTGGMPSPAWRAMYSRLLSTLPKDTLITHWGDVDEGGFRIAYRLAADAKAVGRQLAVRQMSPSSIDVRVRRAASKAKAQRMSQLAARAGWEKLAAELLEEPCTTEQEALSARRAEEIVFQ